jgi:hypothetical protein
MLDYHMLKRENQILKEENKLLRSEVLRRLTTNPSMSQSDLVDLVSLQRMRIDNLEREYDQLLAKLHERPLVNQGVKMADMGPAFELQEKLEDSERKCRTL